MALIMRAFEKLDRNGDGVITLDDMKTIYITRHEPLGQSAEWKDATGIHSILKIFSGGKPDSMVCLHDKLEALNG